MENHNFLAGKIHYKSPFSIAILTYPEGNQKKWEALTQRIQRDKKKNNLLANRMIMLRNPPVMIFRSFSDLKQIAIYG